MPKLVTPSLLRHLDATVGFVLCKLLSRWLHLTTRSGTMVDAASLPLRRVLVIRPGGMGDMLMLLPVLHALKKARPHALIDLVCERRNQEVVRLANSADTVLLYDADPLGLIAHLRRTAYDAVLDTEQFHNFSAIMALLSGARVRVGFKLNPARLTLYTHLVNYDVEGYESDQFTRLLAPLAVEAKPAPLHGFLAGAPLPSTPCPGTGPGPAPAGAYVAICGGSSNPYKVWGATRFRELISRLGSAGYATVLLGGPGDRKQAAAILAAGPRSEALVDRTGALDLASTAGVIRNAALFAGCDSGLAHLAVALERPTVVLFGPSDEAKWATPAPGNRVIRTRLPCAPCSIFGYHKLCRDIRCMSEIQVDEVFRACTELLA